MENKPKVETPIHWTASILIIIASFVGLFFGGIIVWILILCLGFIPMQIYDRRKYGKKKFDKMTIDDYGKTIG